jgi:hypothetical protein
MKRNEENYSVALQNYNAYKEELRKEILERGIEEEMLEDTLEDECLTFEDFRNLNNI